MSAGLSTERDKWLAERRKGIGASDAPTVCGIRTRPTRLELWLQKRGEIESDPPTEAMAWGLRLEPLIAEAYTERTGLAIARTQWHEKDPLYPWMTATIDAYTERGTIVEFKAVGAWSGRSLDKDGDPESLPEPWIIQGQHQMQVFNRQSMTFAVFVDMGLRLYDVQRNDDMLADIITMEEEFWRSVESGQPPAEFAPEDAQVLLRHFKRETGECVVLPNALLDTAKEFEAAQSWIKENECQRDQSKAALLMAMGNASVATCGPYTIKRKLVNVKERTQTIKASSYVRFTVSSGDNDE